MKLIARISSKINEVLYANPDPIVRARINVLFYLMSFSVLLCIFLIISYSIYGPVYQLVRIIFIAFLVSFALYKLIALGDYRPAAHVIMFVLNLLVWTNVLLLVQGINIVTIQYVLIGITASFYLLNSRAGMIYSMLILLPVVLHLVFNGTYGIQVKIPPQQVSDSVFILIMLFNFSMIIFINYHFLRAFFFALQKLKESQQDEQQLNEKLKDAIATAEASSRAKSDFLSTMSHELRTPLNSVIGMSYVLLESNPRKDQEENLKVLHFSAGSLLSLINDILDFNKLDYEKIQLEHIEFSPSELMNSIYSGFQFQAEEKGLVFKLNISPNLTHAKFLGDPTRLLQILFNLIGNAIKFTSRGFVDVDMGLTETEENHSLLRISIADSGIGIAPEHQEIIFEPFSQASTNITRKFGGTGLGLAITKQLLELHDSKLIIQSELGIGTTFTFSIRYENADLSRDHGNVEDNPQSKQTDLTNLKVLVAEDNSMNVFLMQKLFLNWGVNADFVLNGKEAVAKTIDKRYDVILMDIHMPVMDGYEATRQIIKMHPVTRRKPWIIALTASVATGIHTKIREVGLDDYLSKPFNPIELKNKLVMIARFRDDAELKSKE